jgi:limonene-1,2-epoxide hydrolase
MVDAERIVRDFCAAWGEGKVEQPDPDVIADFFAENGEWHLWVPGDVIRGREAIRAEVARQREFSTYMQCGIKKLIAAGSTVMTERLDYFTMHERRVAHALVAVYDLDSEGKILSWREYFDTADIGRQLDMKPEEVIAG